MTCKFLQLPQVSQCFWQFRANSKDDRALAYVESASNVELAVVSDE